MWGMVCESANNILISRKFCFRVNNVDNLKAVFPEINESVLKAWIKFWEA